MSMTPMCNRCLARLLALLLFTTPLTAIKNNAGLEIDDHGALHIATNDAEEHSDETVLEVATGEHNDATIPDDIRAMNMVRGQPDADDGNASSFMSEVPADSQDNAALEEQSDQEDLAAPSDTIVTSNGCTINEEKFAGTCFKKCDQLIVDPVARSSQAFSFFKTQANSDGSQTGWSNMPGSRMKVDFTLARTASVVVHADIPRVQQEHASRNCAFRIIVGTTEIAQTNSGGCASWKWHAVSFHGTYSSLHAGSHIAEVQYASTNGGKCHFFSNADGYQNRGMSVLVARPADLVTAVENTASSGTSKKWSNMPHRTKVSFNFGSGSDAIVHAYISRVQHSSNNQNCAFRLIVDGKHVIAETNTGKASAWDFHSIALHGVKMGLPAGQHTAELQYRSPNGEKWHANGDKSRVAEGTCHFNGDANGQQFRRITVQRASPGDLTSREVDHYSTNYNDKGSSTSWKNMPVSTEASFTLHKSGDVSVYAYISRVQQSHANTNCFFRLLVDGAEVAQTNSGGADSWRFHGLSFHGVKTDLAAGQHTAVLQYKTKAGTTCGFYSDANAYQHRRISVLAHSKGAAWHRIGQNLCKSSETCKDNEELLGGSCYRKCGDLTQD